MSEKLILRQTLPRPMTVFVGRKKEMAATITLLRDPACQLLTLVGVGGSGKTRLALEIAHRSLAYFQDGVFFVTLQHAQNVDDVITAIVSILPLHFVDEMPLREQLLEYLSWKQLLLVLDNFEHLLHSTDLLAEMMQVAPDIKLLVTSREVLNVMGEWIRHIGGLAYPTDTASNLTDNHEAIQLFADCARRLDADFQVTDEQAHVIRICQLVDGMPLALEIAASWLKVLPCAEIANEIAQNLDILVNNQRHATERHRSIRAVFNHTWHLLSHEQQQVFCQLAVFQNGFERDAAEQIANTSVHTLVTLIDKSLLQKDADGRYHIHELLRQYATEKLEASTDKTTIRDAHSHYYAHFMQQRENNLKGHRQLDTLNEIEPDFENVQAAWAWAVTSSDNDTVDQMLECLYLYCDFRSRYQLGEALFRQACIQFESANGTQNQRLHGRLLTRHCLFYRSKSAIDERLSQAAASLRIAQQHQDDFEIAYSLSAQSRLASDKSEFQQALTLATKSREHYQIVGDEFYVVAMSAEVATYLQPLGKRDEAAAIIQQGLIQARQTGNQFQVTTFLNALSAYYLAAGDYETAESVMLELAAAAQIIDNWRVVAWNQASLGVVACLQGNLEACENHLTTALSIAHQIHHRNTIAYASGIQAMLACLQGDTFRAAELCAKARPMAASLSSNLALDFAISMLSCQLGDVDAARRYCTEMLKTGLGWRGNAILSWALPAAAYVKARTGNAQQAAMLLALAYSHPANATGWLDKWQVYGVLRTELEAELGLDSFRHAWRDGTTLDIETVVQALLAEDSISTNQPLIELLSERELEILKLISEGLSNRDIAQELVIAIGTVKAHTSNIYGKLGVKNRIQAVAQAQKLGLL